LNEINFEADMLWNKQPVIVLIGIIACIHSVQAQEKVLSGILLDKQSV
jgi:hypothetical protein